MKEIPVARVSTVWMEPTNSREYLIVGDQFLWFGKMMNHYLINTNQVRELNIPVHNNPSNAAVFIIVADETLTPFTSKGKIISFES